MFGHWYATRDAALMKGDEKEQLSYARELLAEVLNRAQMLGNMFHGLYDQSLKADQDRPLAKMDYAEARDTFLHAAGIFVADAEEVLARARRARLVYGADNALGGVGTGSVDNGLESLGGSLVPWHIDDAIARGDARLVFPKEPAAPKRKAVAK